MPTVLNGAVAMECDVLDARPKPEILWFRNNDPTPVVKERGILYFEGGRFLFIPQLTPLQRMSSYHCEVANAYPFLTHVRAPTTYLLDGNIPSFTLKVYRPVDELNYAVLGEEVTYVYPAASVDRDGINAMKIVLTCRKGNPGLQISIINDMIIRVRGLSGDETTGLATVSCSVIMSSSYTQADLELTFFVGRKEIISYT